MRVSQTEIEKDFIRIKAALIGHENGASISKIEAVLNPRIEQRTLLRRLTKLVELGEVRASGQNKGKLYHPVYTGQQENVSPAEPKNDIIPLTPEAEAVKKIILQPEKKRTPVAYNFDFLMSYRPNIDSYLTEADKKKLAALGKTTGQDQPAGTYAKNIMQRLLIDLAWNSSRLEGNTYSLLETKRLLSFGKAADDKTLEEAQMILNHKEAIEFIVQSAEEKGFNRYTIIGLHALLSNGLMVDSGASGRLRTIGVGIGRSVYMPLEVPQQIEEMFDIVLHKADQIENPFEQAFFITIHLAYLQPFEDVNKRVSRLAANIPFIKQNLSPLSFIDVPKDIYTYALLAVYELNRIKILKDVFMWAYERSAWRYAALRQTISKPDPFASKYREEIRNLVRDIVLSVSSFEQALLKIKKAAEKLPNEDQEKFIGIVDYDLINLNEYNVARFFIRPSEFRLWKGKWIF